MELNVSSSKLDHLPTDCVNDMEEKEVSDDDDDDRNHKHRRRETSSQSLGKEYPDQVFKRPYKKRSRPFENGHPFREGDLQPGGIWKNFSVSLPEQDLSTKFEKRRPGLAPLSKSSLDINQRIRLNQSFLSDSGLVRGRGREPGVWGQRDSRFSSVDIASQVISQGPVPPGLFAGRVPNVANPQNASWGAFGLVPGVPNGGLDPLHSLGWQGTLIPPVNSSLSASIVRQRCRDFEERGFCLRGDMCPMEHGINRIVVEDVQTLSQFNLPGSLPSAHLLGTPSLPAINATSSSLTNTKGFPGKSSTSGVDDDELGGMSGSFLGPATAAGTDFYDPDQPLWTDGCPKTSTSHLSINASAINETESLLDAKSSREHHTGLCDNLEDEGPGTGTTTGSQSTTLSVWGRIGNSKQDREPLNHGDRSILHRKHNLEDAGPQPMDSPLSMASRNLRKPSQKALRTLFVNGIPLENNKREALLAHFRKFGEIIDIYIPMNSERAFVQFSKREEAEAALKSPDAVMGNRFIKLWWANRDSIPDDGISGKNSLAVTHHGVSAVSVPSHLPVVSKGKDNFASVASLGSVPHVPVSPLSSSDKPKCLAGSDSMQKKLESLELLKEELRKKQEMLDKNRNDFKRQLDKLEKQTAGNKGEVASEHVVQERKLGSSVDIAKETKQTSKSPNNISSSQQAEPMTDSGKCTETALLRGSEAKTSAALESPSLKRFVRPLAPIGGAPFVVNRFKLDNRPTSFKIVPPLPTGLANVTALKEHFSVFGDLPSVQIEDLDPQDSNNSSVVSERVAHISFTTRRAAEKAFVNGKCWQGHNMQFAWLTPSNNSSKDTADRENPSSSSSLVHSDTIISTAEEAASARSNEGPPSGNEKFESLQTNELVKDLDEDFQSTPKVIPSDKQ